MPNFRHSEARKWTSRLPASVRAFLKLAARVPGQCRYFLTAGLWDEIPRDSEAANLSSLLRAVFQNQFELSCCFAAVSFPSGCEKRDATPPLALIAVTKD